ncbi:MAG: N utilization substance protein A [bacterium]|jgi:N utilization substance protein A
MKNSGLMEAIIELSQEKGLDPDVVIETLEDAVVAAAYRKYKDYRNIEASVNRKTGEIELMRYSVVVEVLKDSYNEILLEEVRKIDPHAEIGDEVEYGIDSKAFEPIIAQTTRQLLFQKIREVERESVLEKFVEKKGTIVNGKVARVDRNRITVLLSDTVEAVLDRREQIQGEKLQPGDQIRALLLDIRTDRKGPQLILTRTHPHFLIKLLEVEVPEVYEKVIEVVAAAREPGKRAKVAVRAFDNDIDPVGACVGVRGTRVQTITSELCGERIDVIEWSSDIREFVNNAIAPADILRLKLDEDTREADIQVGQEQLSLAIGKQGQNVRLASKLTGIKINVSAWTSILTDGEDELSINDFVDSDDESENTEDKTEDEDTLQEKVLEDTDKNQEEEPENK